MGDKHPPAPDETAHKPRTIFVRDANGSYGDDKDARIADLEIEAAKLLRENKHLREENENLKSVVDKLEIDYSILERDLGDSMMSD